MIKMNTFRILHCFGFEDSSEVEIHSPQGLVYLLGRNSSGKTSFLQAIRHFESGIIPENYRNFANFNQTDHNPRLVAHFVGDLANLSAKRLRAQITKDLVHQNISEAEQSQSAAISRLLDLTEETYTELFSSLSEEGQAWVTKYKNGQYTFQLSPEDLTDFTTRRQRINSVLGQAFPQSTFVAANNQKKQVNYSFAQIEASIFLQFPPIVFFGDAHPLGEDLPERITEADLDKKKEPLEDAFLTLLDVERLRRFFRANDPDERNQLLEGFQLVATTLCDRVNAAPSGAGGAPMVRMTLHEKNGLQVTMSIDAKKSFYRHMSENTKALVAYHIYTQADESRPRVLLFDEPNVGFHPTAQRFLLQFLQSLAKAGNQVLISTHSEYMIDLDFLAGVRLLVTDSKNGPSIKNHPYQRPRQAGDLLSLQPIMDAIGLQYGSQLSFDGKAVLTEGVTDLMYIRAFAKLLGRKQPPLAPARSDAHIKTLIPFFIAQGIGIKIVIDTGQIGAKIQEAYDMNGKHMFVVPVPLEFSGKFQRSGIEDLFSKQCFREMLKELGVQYRTKELERQTNSAFLKGHPSKRLLAHRFLEQGGSHVDVDDFTKENFARLLEFCENDDWFHL